MPLKLFHKKSSLPPDPHDPMTPYKRPIKLRDITHANPQLLTSASLPNLRKKTTGFKMFHKPDVPNTADTTDYEFSDKIVATSGPMPTPRVKKSRSYNFLSKYIKRSKKDSNAPGSAPGSVPGLVPTEVQLPSIVHPSQEMWTPMDKKKFSIDLFDKNLQYNLNKLHKQELSVQRELSIQQEEPTRLDQDTFHEGNLLERLQLDDIEPVEFCDFRDFKLNEIPHSTEIYSDETENDNDVDDNYEPQNKMNQSLVNNYHSSKLEVLRKSARISGISTSSNILQDLSSINLEPSLAPQDYEESRPLMNSNRLSRESEQSIGYIENIENSDVSSRTKKLSIPNTRTRLSSYRRRHLNDINEQETTSGVIVEQLVSSDLTGRTDSPFDWRALSDSTSTDESTSRSASKRSTFKKSTTQASESNDNLTERSNFADTEFETFKDVKFQVIKNYSVDSSSKVKIVSPARSPVNNRQSMDELNRKVSQLQEPIHIPSVDFSNIPELNDKPVDYCVPENPSIFATKDQVYRSEMRSLVETHSLMVTKKQEEIEHLKDLLMQERKINTFLSSPQQSSSRDSSPLLPMSPRFSSFDFKKNPATSSSPDESKKRRTQFIPLSITVTEESKPANYIPLTKDSSFPLKDSSCLLPPFQTSTVTGSHSNKSSLSGDEFNLKPFHKYKVTSPSQNDVMHYDLPLGIQDSSEPETDKMMVTDNELKQSVSFDGLGITTNRNSAYSESSSIYFTAFDLSPEKPQDHTEFVDVRYIFTDNTLNGMLTDEEEDDDVSEISPVVQFDPQTIHYTDLTPLKTSRFERREVSGSTTMSSVMSKNANFSDDSIMNTSLASCMTTPDSTEFKFDKH